jgi:hypothetical protein
VVRILLLKVSSLVEQQPAPIAFITAVDTDIQTLAVATTQLSEYFPQVGFWGTLNLPVFQVILAVQGRSFGSLVGKV